MCLSKIFIYVSFIPILLFAQSGQKKVYTHAEIGAIIQKVNQGNKASLDQLMTISLGDHPITLTQDIVKVVVFGLIRSNQTAKLSDYLKKVDPGLVSFLDDKKLNHGCKECEGEGHSAVKCTKCIFGKCYNCKGVGYIEYKGLKGVSKSKDPKAKEKSICNTCHGTGKCLRCKGEGEIKKDCPHCRGGQTLNKNSLLKEMIKSIQNISKHTDSHVETNTQTETQVESNQELESLFNQSVKKSVEQNSGSDQIDPMEETGIQKAFKKSKAYIEGYETKNSKDIAKEISLKYIGKVPALVLDLTDSYADKIDSTKVREVTGFKKYWEDQAVIHGYDKEVATLLMHNGVQVNEKFTLSEKYKRVK